MSAVVLVNGLLTCGFGVARLFRRVMFVSLSGRMTNRLGRSKVALATVVVLTAVLGGIAPVAIITLGITAGAPAPLTGVPVKLDTPGKATPAKVVNQATRTYEAGAIQWPAAA